MRFKDKTALVTGSSRGIGRATAIRLAKEGANVIINYVESKDEAEKVVQEIKKLGSDSISIKCDISKETEVKKMVEQIIKKFGKIDILVNNAGIVFDVPFSERTVEQWEKTLGVNLIGTFLVSKYTSEHMKKKKQGVIVNISSNNGLVAPSPSSVDYDASKAGVISLTKNLAEELAPYNIRVNSIAPGWVDTEMNKDLPEEYIQQEANKAFMKRFARPEEIASVVSFLASDDASFMTGSIVMVDGGYK